MTRTHRALLTVPAALGLAAAATLPAAAASARRPRAATSSAPCSKSSHATLQVQREDTGQRSVDFGVDGARHVAGITWSVRVTDNGRLIASGAARTGPDGSFDLTRVLAASHTTHHYAAVAVSRSTGESCRVAVTA